MASDKEQFQVTVHPYSSPARGSCAYELGNTSSRNAIIFIGGLSDGPHTTAYIRSVARKLEAEKELSYSVFETRMRSSYTGFGASSLMKDVEDISALVKYLRSLGKEKVVLFGHSTGCQDCIEYTDYVKHNSIPVDGFILQAPVSDRESLEVIWPEYQDSLDLATDWIAKGKADDCLPSSAVPRVLGVPVTAYRMHSLLAKGGDDDYFSSDLDDEFVNRVWGRFKKPVLVLHSETDEFALGGADQVDLNKKYRDANPVVSSLSGLIPGADHTVSGKEPREWLAKRVVEFLGTF